MRLKEVHSRSVDHFVELECQVVHDFVGDGRVFGFGSGAIMGGNFFFFVFLITLEELRGGSGG